MRQGPSARPPTTPVERFNSGRDFVPTNKWVVFGHHFAASAGPGPLIGPTLAMQFGYLWRMLWQAWRFLREVSGDDAYEPYLLHITRFHPGQTPMTRADHFKFRQEQKWNRLSRCC